MARPDFASFVANSELLRWACPLHARLGLVAAEPYAGLVMLRDATGDDWPDIYPFFAETVAAGKPIYPEDLSSEQARALWMQPPPWRTIVAVEGEQMLGTAILGPNSHVRRPVVPRLRLFAGDGSG